MANLVDYISLKLRPYSRIITITFLLLIFIIASYYAYVAFMKPQIANRNKPKFDDVANESTQKNSIVVRMFHVDWCPHCLKALPEWHSFCDQYNGKEMNGYKIVCDRNGNNCTKDQDPTISQAIDTYNITQYPTVFLIKDNQRYDFDAKITATTLEQFVQKVSAL